MSNIIKIQSLKYDYTLNKTWQAEIINKDASLLVLLGKFEENIKHKTLGVIGRGTISYEFYWLDRWYNVFCFHEPNGKFRNFYCNINVPPTFDNQILSYVDLDIDILVSKDFSYQILDLDEFEENAVKYSYPAELFEKTQTALSEVIFLIENKIFPFNFKF